MKISQNRLENCCQVEGTPNAEAMLDVAKKLRLEKEKEKELQNQKQEQRTAIQVNTKQYTAVILYYIYILND